MPITNLRIEGLDRLNGKMKKFSGEIQPYMERTTKEAVIFVHSTMPDYPPEPATSSYQRTLTLWRTITSFAGTVTDALSRVESLFGQVVGYIGTKLDYAPWVIDQDQQTQVHQNNGWWNLQDVVVGARDGIVSVYERGMKKLISSIFD
jgi:hypothetical protein